MDKEDLELLIDKHKDKPGSLIALLEEIQKLFGYLPEEAMRLVSEKTGHSLVDIFGVATFYKAFSLEPRGKHLVTVCLGTACHVRGASGIIGEFESRLGIKAGETTADKEFTVETVNCLGACALGPTVVADGHYFSHVSKKNVKEIIAKTRKGLERVNIKTDKRIFPLKVSCHVCRKSLMDQKYLIDGHPSIKCAFYLNGKEGWLRLSSLYGSYSIASEHEIRENSIIKFLCPHCGEEFGSFSDCKECGSPMAAMLIHDECTLEVCTRRGCPGHLLNFNQININAVPEGR